MNDWEPVGVVDTKTVIDEDNVRRTVVVVLEWNRETKEYRRKRVDD